MRRVDAETAVSVDLLMDQAGFGIALIAADWGAGYGSVVTILCGKGNNGGDGYIAAAYLAERGATVRVQAVGEPPIGSPAYRAMQRAKRNGVRIEPIGVPGETDYLIDAVVGTGFMGELRPEVAAWTCVDAITLAVDIPSGLNGDTGFATGAVFEADATVTFHALKQGHLVGDGPDLCGEITVVDIGLEGGEPTMMFVEDEDVVVPERARTDHKWSAGAVAVIGGMPGLTGAALFAARAALAGGAGVSNLVTLPSTASAYRKAMPAIPTMEIPSVETEEDALALVGRLSRFDTVVVGPGLEPASTAFVSGILSGFDGSVVLDAGALNAVTPDHIAGRSGITVLTPHAAEFRRLAGDDPSPRAAADLASTTGAIVVLKGNPTFVAADDTYVIASGGPELATIGSGDVLAGLIAAFVSHSIDPVTAVVSATHLHGIAGQVIDEASVVTTPDLIAAIGPTVAAYRT